MGAIDLLWLAAALAVIVTPALLLRRKGGGVPRESPAKLREVVIGPGADDELTLMPVAEDLPSSLVEIDPGALGARFAEVIRTATTAMGASHRGSHWALTFSEATTRRLRENSLQLMASARGTHDLRAMAVGVDGRIVEHGALRRLPPMNGAGLALGVWNLAAIAAGHAQLVEVNRALARVEGSLKEIRDLLEDEQVGRLHGHLRHLQDRARSLAVDSSGLERLDSELSTIELNARGVQAQMEAQLQRQEKALEEREKKEILKLHKATQRQTRFIEGLERCYQAYLLSVDVRLVACTLRVATGISGAFAVESLLTMRSELARLVESQAHLHDRLVERTLQIEGRLTREKDEGVQRRVVREAVSASRARLNEELARRALWAERLEEVLGVRDQGSQIQLRLESGQRGEVRRAWVAY